MYTNTLKTILIIFYSINNCSSQLFGQTSNIRSNQPNTRQSPTQVNTITTSSNSFSVNYLNLFGSNQQTSNTNIVSQTLTNTNSNSQQLRNSFSQQKGQSILELTKYQRIPNGIGNNQNNPKWGAANSSLLRLSQANYEDNASVPNSFSLSPRQISNMLGKLRPGKLKLQQGGRISMAFTFWGQFLDHQISLTGQNEQQVIRIPIPWCDKFLDRHCRGVQYLQFKRSIFFRGTTPRQFINQVTSIMDGSVIYGSNNQQHSKLRTYFNGRIQRAFGNILPKVIQDGFQLFRSGDRRANQNVFLISYHTLFMREHNRLCQIYENRSSYLSDEQLFNIGRNYVTALIEKITFQDFLPILIGRRGFDRIIGEYKGYDSNVNPDIATQFSTAAFRIGHALLVGDYMMVNQYQGIDANFKLDELFFRPDLISDQNITKFFRGLRYTPAKKKNLQVINEIRNLLKLNPNDDQRVDLFSFNVQRGKDHGLPSYNTVRRYYGLQPLHSFWQMTSDPETQKDLRNVYRHPDNCDLWVGIIAEDNQQGAIMGELGIAIVGQQFKRMRDGDRFWYQRVMPEQIIRQIKQTTLEDLISRNTGMERLGRDMFTTLNYN